MATKFHSSLISLCTARIEMFFNDTPLATGSSFYYFHHGRSFLVTNRHNLTGLNQDTGKPLDEVRGGLPNRLKLRFPLPVKKGHTVELGEQTVHLDLKWDDDNVPWLEHPILGPKADVVALDFHKCWPTMPMPFAHVNTVPHYIPLVIGPATRVCVVGYPFGQTVADLYPVWVSGSVASDPAFDVDGKPAMFIDCRTNRGASGSPVFAYAPGGLVQIEPVELNSNDHGIYARFHHTDDTYWGMFAVPAQRFLGIYSGRINRNADIGYLWREEVVSEVCGGGI